ncbi:MAG: response regulator transcription factor [Ignavibacteriae bacterium]|nr:response regulator transcription factor [Ignavibacteriota bacterium]
MNKTILIIDDDTKLNELLSEYLTNNGYSCIVSEIPSDAFTKLRKNNFDLIILDVMLPEMDGFEVCKNIRKEYDTPIIMLTARGEVTDKIVGLELGADDYLPKPFEPRELLARISSIVRRVEGKLRLSANIKFKNFTIDINKRTAFVNEKDIELTTAEFELLFLFAKNNGKVLSRDDLMKNTRGISWESYNRSVDVMVSRLRSKLKSFSPKKEEYIKTVHSVGYMFFAEEE